MGIVIRSKVAVLNAVRQSGFSKEDLRDMDWSFSNSLWNSVGGGGVPGSSSFDDGGGSGKGVTLPSALPRSRCLISH